MIRRAAFVLLGLGVGLAAALYVSARNELDAGRPPEAPVAPPNDGGTGDAESLGG
jgi:hypothetical protein